MPTHPCQHTTADNSNCPPQDPGSVIGHETLWGESNIEALEYPDCARDYEKNSSGESQHDRILVVGLTYGRRFGNISFQ
jgi:hypothetical protein